MTKKKAKHTKYTEEEDVFTDEKWKVKCGKLKPGKGRPDNTKHLFKVLGEKLPYEALEKVRAHVSKNDHKPRGVYVVHDSMGCPRYIGRGENVFVRIETRINIHPIELQYFSFYLVEDKKHEREIETLLIRTTSSLVEFNEKKKRVGISHGSIKDYEAGTVFYERQRKKGRELGAHI